MKQHFPISRMRKAIGWFLSVLLLCTYYSPQAALLRTLPDTLSVAAGQALSLDTPFPLRLTLAEGNVQASSGMSETLSKQDGPTSATATISLLGLLPLKEVDVRISDDLRLFPGGQAVGVAIQTQGVLVVGTSDLSEAYSPARLAGLKAGDLITEAGGYPLTCTEDLTAQVDKSGEAPLPLKVRRGENELSLTLLPKKDAAAGSFRIGAWVRDSTAGVGTLSFYGVVQPGEEPRYGALGHAITDADTQQILTVSRGEIMTADIVDVRKGRAGVPGELKGSFLRERRLLGSIGLNNIYGIYGALSTVPAHPLYPDGLPIGRRDGVHTGPASILCTVDAAPMKEYAVELVEVARQTRPAQRSMILRVTDPELLNKTGGIVQGMSGSPILQDGRLIGAVTHVFVSDPTMGYGLFIEWMLAQNP